MASVSKIDSNITGFAYAEEAALGLLPGEGGLGGTPVWNRLEPNSYSDFGGELVTVAPNPINSSRQRKKGVGVDLNANGGYNHNLSFYNHLDLLQGVMFADIREKGTEAVTLIDVDLANPDEFQVASTTGFVVGSLIVGVGFAEIANNGVHEVTALVADTSVEVADGTLTDETPPATAFIKVCGVAGASGDIDVDASGALPKLTSTILDFTTLGLVVGQWIFLGGDTAGDQFTTAANNGFKRVRNITTNALTLDKSVSAMVTEASVSVIHVYFGDVLKNEDSSLISRKSYNLERLLGAPNDSLPAEIQSEHLIGQVPSELSINIPSAELLNIDMSFIGTDHQTRTGAEGPKQTGVLPPHTAEVYNTTSDFSRIKMALVSSTDEAPTPLFAFITEATLTINNNLTVNKAVGVLGGFDITAGTFTVSGSLTAYFSDVAAVNAVRNNSDITIDVAIVKDNRGMVIDYPLVSLGDGRLNVEQDQPITLPLNLDAATAESIDSNLDYTTMFTFFHYLPTAAE